MDRDGKELAKRLLEEFWLLSLTLEQVLEEGCWEEVPVLLQRREEALQVLEAISPQPEWLPLLSRALDADERCQHLLAQNRQALLNELTNEAQQRHCAERYQEQPSTSDHRMEQEG
jgi:hypothetical protein